MLAGPSEVLVIADETGDANTIAADLLAQVHTRHVHVLVDSRGLDLRSHLTMSNRADHHYSV